MPGAYLWGWTGTAFKEVRVDAAGHLQVDVLSITDPSVKCMGWDGGDYEYLQFESIDHLNLRVKLFDGATGIGSNVWDDYAVGAAGVGLLTNARIYGKHRRPLLTENTSGDNRSTTGVGEVLEVISLLYGFDGTNFDRLRTYGTRILTVAKGGIGATIAHPTAVGLVYTGAAKIFWVACTPDSPSAEWEISDDLDGSTTAIYCHFDADKHSEHFDFNPPIEVSTGIYIKKFDKMKCLHICYKV